MKSRYLLALPLLSMAVAAGAHADPLRVGISVGSLGNPFFVAAQHGAIAAARATDPNAQVTTVSSDYDLNKQVNQIDNFISAGDKLVLLNAADPVAIAPAVKRAEAAGVVIAAFDVAAKGATVTAMTDNIRAGQMSCQFLADQVHGKGNVIIINGPHVSSVIDRVKGCEDLLAKYPGIKILNDNQDAKGSRDGGFAVAQSILTQFPHIDGMFVINEEEAIGTDLAAHQANRKEMIITSVDGSPDGTASLKSADSRIVATAAQNPYEIARVAIKLGLEAMSGHVPEPSTVLLAPVLVTRANVGSYPGWVNK
jgi:ribose transport system substrate-binding protein